MKKHVINRATWLSIFALIAYSGTHAGAKTTSRALESNSQVAEVRGSANLNYDAMQPDIKRIANALENANNKAPSAIEERNAIAQEKVAAWAPLMFGVGAAETLITFFGVFLVWRTLFHTRKAAIAAQEAVTEAKFATEVTREQSELGCSPRMGDMSFKPLVPRQIASAATLP